MVTDEKEIVNLEKLANAMAKFMELSVDNRYNPIGLFSRTFILKNLFKFTDEELKQNEEYLINEKAEEERRRKLVRNKLRLKSIESTFEELGDSDVPMDATECDSSSECESKSKW